MSQSNQSPAIRRRGPLRSRTVDTFLRILSVCSVDPSLTLKNPDNGNTHIGSETNNKVPSTRSEIIPNSSLPQKEKSVDETQVVIGTQEGHFGNKHVEPTEQLHKISEESNDLSQKVDINPSKKQDDYEFDLATLRTEDQITNSETPICVTDMIISSPCLLTDTKDFEEGEISEELTNFLPEDDTLFLDNVDFMSEISNELGLENDDFTPEIGKGMAGKTERNLVDYSEIAVHGKSRESDILPIYPQRVLPLKSSLKNSATMNQEFVSTPKDIGAENNSEERINKKAKKSVDLISAENLKIDEDTDDDSQEDVDDSAKKDGDTEKKKKRVLTKERKAKKKRKERIKRAEKNRKLGVKRLKIQPFIKEKKVSYCRHYMKGRCHEGEKCKFSHDTIPLTKSKPCCHFARHACMKGDECPYDHQLSKYPCNNYLTKGFCNRGSECMFSHEVQPSDTPVNPESKAEQNPSSILDNSGSKKLNNNNGSSRPVSIPIPKPVSVSVSSNTEQNQVAITPKLPSRPPKGITFFSQEKPPLETQSSPKVTVETASDVVQVSKEMTKTPPVIPRGINFLSFGNKPGLDNSKDGFSFKSLLSNVKGSESDMKSDDKNTNSDDKNTKSNDKNTNTNDKHTDSEIIINDSNSSQKPMHILPFMPITSRRSLQSTVAFAANFMSSVKSNTPANSSQK